MYEAKTLTTNLMVANVEVAINFYTEALEFETVMAVPETGQLHWAMLKKDKVNLMFQLRENLQKEYPDIQESIGGSVILYCDINGVESLYQRLKPRVAIHKELHLTFYGMQEFTIKDRDGYLITFAENKNAPS